MEIVARAAADAANSAMETIISGSTEIRTMAAVLLACVTASVCLRCYVRLHMLRVFAAEDWAMLVAFLFSAGQCAIAIIVVDLSIKAVYGDQHASKVNTKLTKYSTGMFALALVALKISLGFFFLKIFSHKKYQRWAIITLCILCTIAGLAYFAFASFTCTSLLQLPGSKTECDIQPVAQGVFHAFSIVSIASDYTFTIMAVYALWKAKLPVTTKIPACLLLIMGTVGGVASTIRFSLLVRPVTPDNYLRSLLDVGKWTILEHAIGVIAANLAMTRPLLHAFVQRIRGGASTFASRGDKSSRAATGGSRVHAMGASKQMRSANQDIHETNGEAYLLHDIKREVTVVIDEEKASADSDSMRRVQHLAYQSQARPRGI